MKNKIFLILSILLLLIFAKKSEAVETPFITTDYLFDFAVYGDSQNQEVHQEIAHQIEKLDPDFVLHTGDLVQNGDDIDEWNKFREITSALRQKKRKLGLARSFYPAMGNHDIPPDNYFRIFNFDQDDQSSYYYSFDYKGFHFVSLNTEKDIARESRQFIWLEKDLEAAKDSGQTIIPFFHRHIFSSNTHENDIDLQDPLVPLFEESGARLVFTGHDHFYERTFPLYDDRINLKKGITYIVGGGGGGKLSTGTEENFWTAKYESTYHFLYGVAQSNRISLWAINNRGEIFDSFEIPLLLNKKWLLSSPQGMGRAQIRRFDQKGRWQGNDFFAFSSDFFGGTNLARGDLDLDGKDEIIAGAGEAGGPQIRIFKTNGKLVDQFYAFSRRYKRGLDVASSDVDSDGKDEVAVSKFSGDFADVKIFRFNKEKTTLFERNVFPKSKTGARIALGDVDMDGRAELVAASDSFEGGKIKIFDLDQGGKKGKLIFSFYPFGKKVISGLDVATGDVDGDGGAEIVVSILDKTSQIKVFDFKEKKARSSFRPFPAKYKIGANIEMFDANGDGKEEIIASMSSGEASKPQVRVFEQGGRLLVGPFLAYDRNFKGGVVMIGVNDK